MPFVKDYAVYSLREEGGQWSWLGRDVQTADGLSPKIDFGRDASGIRVVDVNFDGLVDVVRVVSTGVQVHVDLAAPHPQGMQHLILAQP